MNWRTTTSMGILRRFFTYYTQQFLPVLLTLLVIITFVDANNINSHNDDNTVTGKTPENEKETPNQIGNHEKIHRRYKEIDTQRPFQVEEFEEHSNSIGHRRRFKRQINNDYERFYLCLFTLFTNPNCRQQQDFNNQNHNQLNFQNNYDPYPDTNSQFVPLFPQQNQQQNNRPGGIFGLGLGIGQSLFGGGRFQQNQQHQQQQNFYPVQNQQQQQDIFQQPQPLIIPVQQAPYLEQQVHRRPGPAVLPTTTTTAKTTTTTTTKPTTTTTTTRRPSTTISTTTRPSTTRSPPRRPLIGLGIPSNNQRYPPNRQNIPVLQIPLPTGHRPFIPSKLLNVDDCENKTKTTTSTTRRPTSRSSTQSSFRPSWSQDPTTRVTTTTTLRPWTTSTATVIKLIPKPKPPTSPIVPIKIEELHSDIFDNALTLKITKLEEENRALRNQAEQVTSFQVQVKYLQEALSLVQTENVGQKARVKQLERTNEHLQKQNGQLQHQTGDQRTRLNELTSKVKYLEEKLIKMSRQSLPLTREIERHREVEMGMKGKIRELTEQINECRNQVYQYQIRNPHRVGIPADTGEMTTLGPIQISSEEDPAGNHVSFEVYETTLRPQNDDLEATTIGEIVETTVLPRSQDDETSTSAEDVVTVFASSLEQGSNDTSTTTTTTEKPTTSTTTTERNFPIWTGEDDELPIIESEFPPSGPYSDIIFDEGDDDENEFAVGDPALFNNQGGGSFAPGSFSTGLEDQGQFSTNNFNPFNNPWSLPGYPQLVNERQFNDANAGGYGQNQVYYRHL